tara:strand:+ start:11975 stop:12544 length:570 start_codon:yes stop_codon:yes gene_type:complete
MNIKFGITGSISSGKTTAGKIISKGTGPIFSADLAVNNLYKNYSFKKRLAKKFKIKVNSKFKKELKIKILSKKGNLKMLEKMIHPLVRKKMFIFLKKNKEKKFIFFEIPLLIESKLMKHFDKIILIKANINIRKKRYISKGGNSKLFTFLNSQQMKESQKTKFCDHVVVNNKSLNVLKKNLYNIIRRYE